MSERSITVIGGGLAGLVASIAAAEQGARVTLHEAHRQLGGRARSTTGEFVANLGPHALYADGPFHRWLADRDLLPPLVSPHLGGFRLRTRGRIRRTPPLAFMRAMALLRHDAPVDVDLRTWAASKAGDEVAAALAGACGVFSFDHDPGRLSAAFAIERARRAFRVPSPARFVVGGWARLVERLADRARAMGVKISLGSPVDALPPGPVIVATDLRAARRLLGDVTLQWTGTRTALFDAGVIERRGDPYVVSDLDESGWVERFTAMDPSLAPPGCSLVQVQLGARPGEDLEAAMARVERLVDTTLPDWRDRLLWNRRSLVTDSSGALDLPGTTWRDRPAIDRGDGVYLAGDMVAAPGLLSEVSWASAVQAAALAVVSRGWRDHMPAPSPVSGATR